MTSIKKVEGYVSCKGSLPNTTAILGKKWGDYYAVVHNGILAIFENEDVVFADGDPGVLIVLSNFTLVEGKKKATCGLTITSLEDNKKKLSLQFQDKVVTLHWKEMILANMSAGNLAIFGRTISDACAMANRIIPDIVFNSVKRIEKDIELEGLFRIPGAQRSVESLKEQFNQGTSADLTDVSTHDVCGFLKLYFRELSDPLIPSTHYKTFMQTAALPQNEQVAAFSEVLKTLPTLNNFTLTFLLQFLCKIASHSNSNLMTPENIATVFGPTLIRDTDESKFDMGNMSAANSIIKLFVENAEILFDGFSILDAIDTPLFPTESLIGSRLVHSEIEKAAIDNYLNTRTPEILLANSLLSELFYYGRYYMKTPGKDKLETRIFALGKNRMFVFLNGGKIDFDVHYLDITEIISLSKNDLTIKLTINNRITEYVIKSISVTSYDIDFMISWINNAFERAFITKNKLSPKFSLNILPEERSLDITDQLIDMDIEYGCCGFVDTYISICDYIGAPINDEVIWIVENILYTHSVKTLTLSELLDESQRNKISYNSIFKSLSYNIWFEKLEIIDIPLPTESQTELVNALLTNSTLKKLIIRNAGVTKNIMTQLANVMVDNRCFCVDTYDFYGNPIEDISIFAISVEQIGHLVKLDLGNTSIGKRPLLALLSSLFNRVERGKDDLEYLNINGSKLDQDSSKSLGAFLSHSKSIRELDLSSCGPLLSCIASTLDNCASLTSLNVSKNRITNKGENVNDILGFFSNFPNLQILNLSGCTNFDNDFLKTITSSSIIPTSSSLTSLDLSDIEISDENFIEIFDAMRTSPIPLHELTISRCMVRRTKLRDEVLASLKKFLVARPVHSLTFRGGGKSCLKIDIPTFVFGLITNDTSLRFLDISGHFAGDILASWISKMIQHNTELNTLLMDENDITAKGLKTFLTGMKRNNSICRVCYMPKDISKILNVTTGDEISKIISDIRDKCYQNTVNLAVKHTTESLAVVTPPTAVTRTVIVQEPIPVKPTDVEPTIEGVQNTHMLAPQRFPQTRVSGSRIELGSSSSEDSLEFENEISFEMAPKPVLQKTRRFVPSGHRIVSKSSSPSQHFKGPTSHRLSTLYTLPPTLDRLSESSDHDDSVITEESSDDVLLFINEED